MFKAEKKIIEETSARAVAAEAKRAVESLSIHMADFKDVYDVSGDAQKVKERMDNFDHSEVKELATAFENAFVERANGGGWLGDDAFVRKTCLFDDVINGVDVVAELAAEGEGSGPLGLVIDLAVGREVSDKIGRIAQEIKRGSMGTIKYFISPTGDFKGALSNIPRIVICAEGKSVKEFLELWMSRKNALFQKKLENHFLKFQILEQIIIQLKMWQDCSEKLGFSQNARICQTALKTVRKIYAAQIKMASPEDSESVRERDDAFFALSAMVQKMPERMGMVSEKTA